MALDLFGPTVSAGGVTVRPGETRQFTAADTFFKDCSSPDLDDGTEFQAAWFNQMLAALRSLARGNGQTAGSVNIVTEDNSDDLVLLKAMQQLVQRGQPLYGEDVSGGANVLFASLSPAPLEYKKGMTVAIKAANSNTGASVLNLNGLGNKTVVRPDGSTLLDGDISIGSVNTYRYDGTNFQLMGATSRPALKRNTTIYVRTDGNDSNDGTANDAAHALATPQGAINLAFKYGPSAFTMTIVIAAGTYSGGMQTPSYSGPNISVQGAGVGTIIDGGSNANGCSVAGPNSMLVSGIKVQNSAPTGTYAGFAAQQGANLTINNVFTGACGGAAVQASHGASIAVGNITLSGSCYAAFWANFAGSIQFGQGSSCTIGVPITVSAAFAFAAADGAMGVGSPSSMTFGNPSNVTGAKFLCITAGGIDTSGNGINYFPGNSAGAASTPGWYV